jgi:hypothetical protein
MSSRRHPIPRREDTSDITECAAILGTNHYGALAVLHDAGIEPAYRDNGRPHYRTAEVRAVADGRPIIRARRPMY